uniref:Uncharacterized protein n=1 Tax=viral metagenome TaxID=1070528 RepID=A0A6M3LNR6_9ZZZZ
MLHNTQDEEEYYNSRSKRDSQAAAAWCFIAIAILSALVAMSALFGGLAP